MTNGVDEGAVLSRHWSESRRVFSADQTRIDSGRFDSLAKLVASVHRRNCEQQASAGWNANPKAA